MQWMDANAAAAGLKNWCSQQVIGINEHRQQKYRGNLQSLRPEEKKSDYDRKAEVQEVMDYLLHEV
jgi:hypothetical protein